MKDRRDLEKRLLDFFELCTAKQLNRYEILAIAWPLYWHFNRGFILNIVKVILAIYTGIVLVNHFPLINWNLSAIFRLALVKILPYWNWTHLYDEKCLVSFYNNGDRSSGVSRDQAAEIGRLNECSVCEKFG